MTVKPISPASVALWPRTLVLAAACIASALLSSTVTFLGSQVGLSAWGGAMAGGDTSAVSALQALTSWQGKVLTCGNSIPVGAGADAEAPGCLAEIAGFAVHGWGAQACVVGEYCTFTLSIWPPAKWKVKGRIPLEWDLMVTLKGPALVHAYIEASRTSPLRKYRPGATPPARTYQVTYRAWDAGVYRAVVANPCFTLVLPGVMPAKYRNDSRIAQVAAWALLVRPRQQGAQGGSGMASSQLGGFLGRGSADKPAPVFGPSPCTETLQGRWKAVDKVSGPSLSAAKSSKASGTGGGNTTNSTSSTDRKEEAGDYRWEPYECAKWVPHSEVLARLAAKGVKEVAFIGDSHLRFLLLHTVYLLTGKVYPGLLRAHVHFTLPVPISFPPPPPSGLTGPQGHSQGATRRALGESVRVGGHAALVNASRVGTAAGVKAQGGKGKWSRRKGSRRKGSRRKRSRWVAGVQADPKQTSVLFSFYWVDGVFKNGEFGCGTRGTYSHRYDDFAPIITKPDIAILDSGAWSAFRCKQPALAYSAHLNEFLSFMFRQLSAKKCSKMFFYGATPTPMCVWSSKAATNSLLKFEGDLARVLSGHYGMKYFNTWEVVAPKFEESCNSRDPHYSCAIVDNPALSELPQNVTRLGGEVGKALASTFIQFLVSALG